MLARTFPAGREKPWDVDALVDQMGVWFDRWFDAYCVNPWGPERDDWRARMSAIVGGSPGNGDAITWPSSNDAIAKLKALCGEDDGEQQSEESALSVLKAAGVI